MKINRINHLGIVPKDASLAKQFFTGILGLPYEGGEVVDDQQVTVDFIRCENSRLELLQATSTDSSIAKFLATRGAGIQHVALDVDDLDSWVNHLKKNQIRLIDEKPKKGAHNTRIVFIHPHSTGGILVELVEEKQNKN
ncbi:methylmalonyl-CoA epimerase [Spirobacillus cienkowskii]|jgi:methylmalonyl-CoA/ethylmalonyl-CoA epimerase|uniref:Methylmalonyl-CoA epimerase n=1 Tax=Spirobacillus cienkowskii TaxID=495820 RepID=A0A369KWP7_9BACT|nr:MAG: methylmalonyl-CoA epimerase [Spirobacillus cienkowskii]